jgi:large subunit ribosomal protein L29
MKITKEFRELGTNELRSRLSELRKELLKLNVEVNTGNAANPGRVKQNKKNIARILTLLTEKQKGSK